MKIVKSDNSGVKGTAYELQPGITLVINQHLAYSPNEVVLAFDGGEVQLHRVPIVDTTQDGEAFECGATYEVLDPR